MESNGGAGFHGTDASWYPMASCLSDPTVSLLGLWSVLEGTTAAGSTDEVFEHVAVGLPEGSGLGHLGQVVHTEPEAELLQVLNAGKENGWFRNKTPLCLAGRMVL